MNNKLSTLEEKLSLSVSKKIKSLMVPVFVALLIISIFIFLAFFAFRVIEVERAFSDNSFQKMLDPDDTPATSLVKGVNSENEKDSLLEYPRLNFVKPLAPKDCAVALTGETGRIESGFLLLQKKSIKKLIISGVHKKIKLSEILRKPFTNLDPNDIILENVSETTYGNAYQSLYVVTQLNCRNIYLITSSLHMLRAYKMFTHVFPKGFEIEPHTVNESTFYNFFKLIQETMKEIIYDIFFY